MIKLTKEQQAKLDAYENIHLSKTEFEALPEYSASNPTHDGKLGIKMWKRRTPLAASDKDAIWFVGEVKGPVITFYVPIISEV